MPPMPKPPPIPKVARPLPNVKPGQPPTGKFPNPAPGSGFAPQPMHHLAQAVAHLVLTHPGLQGSPPPLKPVSSRPRGPQPKEPPYKAPPLQPKTWTQAFGDRSVRPEGPNRQNRY